MHPTQSVQAESPVNENKKYRALSMSETENNYLKSWAWKSVHQID